jgi:hypothetical protein
VGSPRRASRTQERRLREAVRFFAADFFREDTLFVLPREDALFVFDRDALFALPREDALFVFDRDALFALPRDDALFVFDRDALFALPRDDALFVFDRDAIFVFARAPDLLLVFFFADDLRFVALFERDPDAVFVFRPAVDDLRDERRVEPLPPPPPPPSPSSSSPLPPSSFFATAAAAGTASPIAVPATTFFGVDMPSWSSCASSLAMVTSVRHFDSLNASMNFGTIRSRTISGPCVARYFPAASAASSAIGTSASAAASQLVAAADARID